MPLQAFIRQRKRAHELQELDILLALAVELHRCPPDAPAHPERTFVVSGQREAVYISTLASVSLSLFVSDLLTLLTCQHLAFADISTPLASGLVSLCSRPV